LPEVIRILLSEVQVAEMTLTQVRLEVVRFSGSQEHGSAILLRGEGIVTVAGKEDRVLLSADSASSFSGQWRKVSRREVMQVPVKLTVQGETLSGALVVWEREGQRQGRFVMGDRGDQGLLAARDLAAGEPTMPVSELVIDYFADTNFSEWVGSFIRLCNGATSREGIQDGFSKAETTTSCDLNNPWTRQECWQYIGWDENGDGTPEQFVWFQVNCPPRFPW